jgi:hypothetical protein
MVPRLDSHLRCSHNPTCKLCLSIRGERPLDTQSTSMERPAYRHAFPAAYGYKDQANNNHTLIRQRHSMLEIDSIW